MLTLLCHLPRLFCTVSFHNTLTSDFVVEHFISVFPNDLFGERVVSQGCTQPLAPPAYLPRRSSGRPASRAGWWSPARPPRARRRAPCSQRRRQTRRRAPSPAVCARAGHTDQHSRGRVAGRYWPLCLSLPTCTFPIPRPGMNTILDECHRKNKTRLEERFDRGSRGALHAEEEAR